MAEHWQTRTLIEDKWMDHRMVRQAVRKTDRPEHLLQIVLRIHFS